MGDCCEYPAETGAMARKSFSGLRNSGLGPGCEVDCVGRAVRIDGSGGYRGLSNGEGGMCSGLE